MGEPDPFQQRLRIVRVVVEGGVEAQHLERPDAGVHATALQHHADLRGVTRRLSRDRVEAEHPNLAAASGRR